MNFKRKKIPCFNLFSFHRGSVKNLLSRSREGTERTPERDDFFSTAITSRNHCQSFSAASRNVIIFRNVIFNGIASLMYL